MSQISKCPKLRVVLTYWEALGEVSELRYKNLLYISSKRSYCNTFKHVSECLRMDDGLMRRAAKEEGKGDVKVLFFLQ